MTDQLVPTVRTIVKLRDYARSVIRNWHHVGVGIPAKPSVAVLWAQYMIETGGRDSWGWNIGNTKEIPNDGVNYHALRGVWEGVSVAEAQRLIASGQAVADASEDHRKAVDPKGTGERVSVVFQPPHPATWFSSFESLEQAMEHHLKFLARRFAPAWPAVLAGDPRKFAEALRARGYFTASAKAYADGMMRPFQDFMMMPGYEEEVGTMVLDTAPTLPALPSEEETGSGPIIHPLSYPIDIDPDEPA